MNTKKKHLSLAILIVMTIFLNTFSTYSEPSEWALDSINVLLENNFINEEHIEDNKVKSNITREEFADLVVKVYSQATETEMADISIEDPFDDTDNPMVLKAYNLGIVKGVSSTSFAPSKEITRQEIAKMLFTAINLLEVDTTIYDEAQFNDMDTVANWAKDSINFCSQEGILRGMGDNLMAPLKFTTWEQAIVLINRISEKYSFLENVSTDEEAVEVSTEISPENYEVQENGYLIPMETNILVNINEDMGLHLRLTANGNEGNRDLGGKIDQIFEILKINKMPTEIIEEFKQIINDNGTVFNAPETAEPTIKILDDGKIIELRCDLNVRISIYTPFLNIDDQNIQIDSFTKSEMGYMLPKENDLAIRTNTQTGNKLEITIFDTTETEKIITKLKQLLVILKINEIPTSIIEKIERDISSNWDYNQGKPGQVNPVLEELPNGDQLVYSSGGFVQVKIFSY